MTDQLTLINRAPKLSERQTRALHHITASQPVTSQRLGQHLGGPDIWWTSSGNEVAKVLRRKGLVRYSRNEGGWVLSTWKPGRARSSQGDLPEGY